MAAYLHTCSNVLVLPKGSLAWQLPQEQGPFNDAWCLHGDVHVQMLLPLFEQLLRFYLPIPLILKLN